jgi:BON domain
MHLTNETRMHLPKERPMHLANQVALVIVLLMLVAVAAGCSRPPLPKTESSAGSSSSSGFQKEARNEGNAGQKLDKAVDDAKRAGNDVALTAKVKTALAGDAGLKTLKIDIDANSGVVTLKGRVETDDAKNRIHEITQRVPGVTWVQNQISVAPKPG